jgi:predicted nuclease of predicted toxin-antitoxin system
MRFPCIVIDESVDTRICTALQKDGYNIYYMASHHTCVNDIKIIEVAAIKEAFVITEDKDFGRFTMSRKNLHKGTLLLLLAGLSVAEKNSVVFNAFLNHKDELVNSFTVLTSEKLIVRKYFV